MRLTRSRVVSSFLVLLGGAIVASAGAAQPLPAQQAPQQPQPPPPPAASAIVRPPELQRDVDFWIHIYTVVTTQTQDTVQVSVPVSSP